jgi:hypothetical protein
MPDNLGLGVRVIGAPHWRAARFSAPNGGRRRIFPKSPKQRRSLPLRLSLSGVSLRDRALLAASPLPEPVPVSALTGHDR